MIGFWNLIIVWLKVSLLDVSDCRLIIWVVAFAMAVFPSLVFGKRYRSTWKHGTVCGQ
jgi:hypothetical protein